MRKEVGACPAQGYVDLKSDQLNHLVFSLVRPPDPVACIAILEALHGVVNTPTTKKKKR